MDRRLLVFFASVAILVGAAGYLLAQSRASSTVVAAAPVTLLDPASSPTTTTPAPVDSTIRSTLPPTPSGEVFQYAAGGGCTPGTNALPDGEYYGSVVVNDDRSLAFNLKCLFVADDLPEDFDEIFAARFPGEEFANTGFDLVDVAATDRRVRFAWNSELTMDGGLYVGDDAYLGFVQRDEVAFDAKISIVEGIAVTVTELGPEAISPG